MPEALKVLGQLTPGAAVLGDLYTVPSNKSAVASSIVVCNTSNSVTELFRVSIRIAGAANALSQYVYRDVSIPPNETFIATIGWTLAQTDVISVYSLNGNCNFDLFGSEVG